MSSHVRSRFLALALLAATATAAGAQTALPLTLDEAISRGVANAPRLAEVRAREAAAESIIASRQASRLPTVTASGEYFRTNHIEPFGVVQPIAGPTVV
ncbi:MAG TPA: hypothetical protein VF424_07700, partial [Vicinamibacterales bacterium]